MLFIFCNYLRLKCIHNMVVILSGFIDGTISSNVGLSISLNETTFVHQNENHLKWNSQVNWRHYSMCLLSINLNKAKRKRKKKLATFCFETKKFCFIFYTVSMHMNNPTDDYFFLYVYQMEMSMFVRFFEKEDTSSSWRYTISTFKWMAA